MSPKPKSDPDETLDTFLNKLANLQTQLLTTQDHDGRYITLQQAFESHQTALETKHDTINHALTTLLSTLSSHTTTTVPPHNIPFDTLQYVHRHHVFHSTPISNIFQTVFTTARTTTIPPFHSPPPSIPSPIYPPKIQMFLFYGTDSLDWLFQADQFFEFYNIS